MALLSSVHCSVYTIFPTTINHCHRVTSLSAAMNTHGSNISFLNLQNAVCKIFAINKRKIQRQEKENKWKMRHVTASD